MPPTNHLDLSAKDCRPAWHIFPAKIGHQPCAALRPPCHRPAKAPQQHHLDREHSQSERLISFSRLQQSHKFSIRIITNPTPIWSTYFSNIAIPRMISVCSRSAWARQNVVNNILSLAVYGSWISFNWRESASFTPSRYRNDFATLRELIGDSVIDQLTALSLERITIIATDRRHFTAFKRLEIWGQASPPTPAQAEDAMPAVIAA